MKFTPYSFSRINTFENCPKKFDFNYIQKLGVWVPNLATERGSYIHLLLENDTKEKPTKFKFTMIDDKIQQECIQIYEDFKKSDLGKEYFAYPAEAEVEFGVKKEDGKLVVCSYYDKEALFRGKIDHFIDHKNGLLTMADWKTGKVSLFPAPLQLAMYALWGFLKYPDVFQIKTSFVYVEHLEEKEYVFKREHLTALKKKVIEKIAQIETAKDFPKKESALCNYCEYRKKGICLESTQDEFQDMMGGMVKSYTPKSKKPEKPKELHFFMHPESGCAWVQDYVVMNDLEGLTEEIDETMFWNLTDFGYDERDIEKRVLMEDGELITLDEWKQKYKGHKK